MVYGVIYFITNIINGMKYVGKTTNFKRRISQHKRGIQCVDREIQTYNWENFIVEVLEKCQTQEQLNEREKFWIRKLGCIYPIGYNRTSGGSSGLTCTSETCLKWALLRAAKRILFSANITRQNQGHKYRWQNPVFPNQLNTS